MKKNDAEMLVDCLAWLEEQLKTREPTEQEEQWGKVFAEWVGRARPLTDKQRAWLKDVYEKATGTPQYENAWSAGKVPRGEALATPVPDVLKKPLPLKPPGRT